MLKNGINVGGYPSRLAGTANSSTTLTASADGIWKSSLEIMGK